MQRLNDEVLIYNLTTNEAFCLNDTAAKVFNACDGRATFDELKRQHRFTDDLIHLTLAELERKGLLESYQSNHFVGLTRREVIKRVGLATMIALPVISSLAAPAAASAASTTRAANGQSCSTANSGSSRQCLSGYCAQTSDGTLRCCTKTSSEAGTPNVTGDILGPPVATCDQRIAANCCSGTRATQFGQLCVCA